MNKMPECYTCIFRSKVPGSAHSTCRQPDLAVRGNPHGIKNGWFNYPYNYDPIWKLGECRNYRPKKVEE